MNRPATLPKTGGAAPAQKNLALFRIYVAYRSLLSVVLLAMLASPNTSELVGTHNPTLYIATALAHLCTSIPLLGLLSRRLNQRLMLAVFFTDIIAIIVMADCSGGVLSGLPALLVITVAACAVLISNRTLATLIAALAVLALLGDTVRLILIDVLQPESMFPSGVLGALIFAVSLMIQAVAQRLGQAEELARDRASDLYDLQHLNEQIVQHLDTGILLVSHEGDVRVMNKAASSMLAPGQAILTRQDRPLSDYSEELSYQFEHWKHTGQHRTHPFSVREDSSPVIAHFRDLQPSAQQEALIFVEDYAPITQYAQSLKLNSLGRLTASIAHEIRNPLGAISHAAQLLEESQDLISGDRRMAEIIQTHCVRVNQIVENVMQISRREPPKPEYIALQAWLTQYVSDYLRSLNRQAEVIINCPYNDLTIEFDPDNLQRIISNLLDNALRHSMRDTGAETASITVELDFISNQCLINIIDTGLGVAPADQAKLFEPFYTTVAEGSGMGLYLCKELCEINNASLSYRPTSNGESCFRISLNQRAL